MAEDNVRDLTWIAEEDHRREQTEERAGKEVLYWRWHWTLDPDNAESMKYAEYARLVHRSESVIKTDAHAYDLLLRLHEGEMSVSEARKRANMSTEREAVAEAVAEARGIRVTSADNWHRDEVKEVEKEALRVAREHGTSVADEARRIAQGRVEDEHARQRAKEEAKELHGALVAEMRVHISNAQDHLHKAAVAEARSPRSEFWRVVILPATRSCGVFFFFGMLCMSDGSHPRPKQQEAMR